VSGIRPSPDLPPAGISLRPARREDEAAIRALVKAEHLNPFNIHWENFLVAEDPARRIVGIGQVKTHRDGSRELASIATAAEWRRRGVASAIIRALLARESSGHVGKHSAPLYLMCRDALESFYARFGFRAIARTEMPPYFRRAQRFVSLMQRIFASKIRVIVMKRE
jgi:N-acetylglutamate synthase-like GNAT family acetyltransferase